MEYSQSPFNIYPEPWSNWQQSLSDHSYPSQYLASRQNSLPLSDSSPYCSQYPTLSYVQTCPLPQLQSPYQSVPYSQHSRPKSMSWPRGMFTAPPASSAWSQNHDDSIPLYYQDCHYEQVQESYVDPGMQSMTPKTPAYLPISSEESKTPMAPSVPYEFEAAETSPNEEANHPPVTSALSMSDAVTSVQSTSLSIPMTLHSLPVQPDLLGLNCRFSPCGPAPAVSWPVGTANEGPEPSAPPRTGLDFGSQLHAGAPSPKLKQKKHPQGSRIFACDFCDMKFDRKSNLKDHNRTHGVGKRCVPCHFPGCKKFYGRKADVNRHVRSFHQKDSVSCERCHKKFLRSDSLTRHNIDNCRHQKETSTKATTADPSPQWYIRPRPNGDITRLSKKA